MGYKVGVPANLDRACCTRCEAEVMIAYQKGKPFLLEAGKTYHGYRVNVNHVAQVGLFHVPHNCKWADEKRRRNRLRENSKTYLRTSLAIDENNNFKHYLMGGVPDEIAKPYEVACTRCKQEADWPCLNLAVKKEIRYNKRPHDERIDAGLAAQGLGKWFDRDAKQFYVAPLPKE